ncbi:hypothetical protein Tco_0199051 [Tanacetum coccineum]
MPKVDDVSLVDGVFDGAFGGDEKEDVVMGEGAVVASSLLERLTKSCLGGMMIKMGLNTSVGQLCLGENNYGSAAEEFEKKEQWDGLEFQDTAGSEKKEAKIFTFHRMEEKGERYFTPCHVGRLHTYDREINLDYEKNLISNEFAVKMYLEYEERNGEKLVNRELLVSFKWEFYFVKFIINPKEDDVEPCVIMGRSFIRLAKRVVDFGNGIITIHPNLDFLFNDYDETKKVKDSRELMFDL